MMSYIDLDYKPNNDLVCEFYVEPSGSVKTTAEQIASESSIGTWTDVQMEPRIKKLGAKVFEIRNNNIKIAYPLELFEPGNMPQILSSIVGNIFGMKSVRRLRLNKIIWPDKLTKSFPGPLYGIKGVRKILKISKRPLCGCIVKPKLGLNEREHARVAYNAWIGGIDIVKDDENLTSLRFNKFEKRVVETLKARDKTENKTGERKMYMPNVTAETNEMIKRAKFVKNHGGEYVMVDIITVGWAALQTLRGSDLKLVLHAHRAGHAALTRGKHGISMAVIADISRLIGVDQLHIGTSEIGKMKQEDDINVLRDCLTRGWCVKPVFPVASGGLHPGVVPRLVKVMGKDLIAQFGGGCHGHPQGTTAGARAIRQAIDAVMENIDLKKYAKYHKELKVAIAKWGC